MIDSKTEYIYNIILSVFLGIMMVLAINSLFMFPRTVEVYLD